MNRLLLAACLSIAYCGAVFAQPREMHVPATASQDAAVARLGGVVNPQSGTRLKAQLENGLDVRHAKPGDPVVLKTTQAIEENGQTVPKGALVIGHVIEVRRSEADDQYRVVAVCRMRPSAQGATGTRIELGSHGHESSITVAFDRIEEGSTQTPISARIVSVTKPEANPEAPGNRRLKHGTTFNLLVALNATAENKVDATRVDADR
jgi:hypothetical protein